MRSITFPIRENHQQQLPWLEKCSDLADLAGDLPVDTLIQEVDCVLNWLKQEILPTQDVEDRILYPTIAVIMGAPQATNTMRVDHTEFRSMAHELEYLDSDLKKDHNPETIHRLRNVLYSLHTLLKLHYQKEEQVYLAIIDDHLTSEQGRRLLDAMTMEQRQRSSLQNVIVSQWVSV